MSDLGDFDLDQFKATYFEECSELLADSEERLMSLQQDPSNVRMDDLHAIFRAVHSVKGGGGAFNFDQLVSFAHVYEALLDSMRDGKIAVTIEVIELLLSANDVLNNLIQAAQSDKILEEETWADVVVELEALHASADLPDEHDDEDDQGLENSNSDNLTGNAIGGVESTEKQVLQDGKRIYRIIFLPEPGLLKFGNEPLLLIRELRSLGALETFIYTQKLPDIAAIVSDEIYFSWVFFLTTEQHESVIEEVFEFVEFDCRLDIQPAHEGDMETARYLAENHGDPETILDFENASETSASASETEFDDEVVLEKTSITENDIETLSDVEGALFEDEAAAEIEETTEVEKDNRSSIPVEAPKSEPVVQEKSKAEAKAQHNTGSDASIQRPGSGSIRVELDRVDRLVNMVGELVITQSMLRQKAEDIPHQYAQFMKEGFDNLASHTRELQDGVMAIRMQPVKTVFQRIPRLVRELSSKLDKKVDVVTTGENTEVDKTVIEMLVDPLTHMIRNALDHGIETEEERVKKGKDPRATIKLSAEHRGGRIYIELTDDGQGIDRERVLTKAIEKGIILEKQQLSGVEIDELIFKPGFSTAAEVTDLSGRGVGMDVVCRNIASLGGRISVTSEPGQGSRFKMSLPLTLAVLDGMIMAVGTEKYVIPLTAILETLRPAQEDLHHLVGGGDVILVRGDYIPLIYLYKVFSVADAVPNPAHALVVIVELDGGDYAGLVVDDLLGQQQVVIKNLEDNFDPVAGVSAATILGDGRVSLILDVDGLMDMSHGRHHSKNLIGLEKNLIGNNQNIISSENGYG